jgi:hypothetical protein
MSVARAPRRRLVPTMDVRSVHATIVSPLGRIAATSTAALDRHFEDLGICST